MTLNITKHTETFSSCPQINPEDIPEISKLGFKTLLNARPDHEGGDEQPESNRIKKAAENAGLNYVHIPVIPNNINATDIETCASNIAGAPTPILGFCKTGMRATSLYQSAQQTNKQNTATGKENWLMQKINYFLKNKCLLTRLYRKLSKANV